MSFSLSAKSLAKLDGVHPDLVRVVKRAIAISEVDFAVIEGVRTMARQRELVASGASKTLKGRHIPDNNRCGMSCAVDLAAFVGGKIEWSWPLYPKIAAAMKQAAAELAVPIEWGGDWKTLRDGPHFQLPWRAYP
jgi:peptidoglycan LD-endopeptidase CwlK